MPDINSDSLKGEMPGKEEILHRIDLKDSDPKKLVVTPLIDQKQIQDGTIDLRLGTEFVVARRSKYATIDPLDGKDWASRILAFQEKTYVRIGDSLILHPGQFALGGTFEYLKLPVDLLAYVLGRSSWGRLGLIIATATVVHPRYAGIITLELTNIGDTPITLYPGTRIAQLALHKVDVSSLSEDRIGSGLEESKYQASVTPVFSKIFADKEWQMLKRIRDKSSSDRR